MKQSTKWWIAVVAMLLVGAVVAQVSVVPGIAYRATPLGLVAAAAALFGAMVAFAIIPLVVAAITRFRWPWVVLGLYVLCAGFAVVGIHNNTTHRDAELAVHQSVGPESGIVGTDSRTGTTSLENPSPQTDRQAQEAATTPDWLKNAKWGPPAGNQAQEAAFVRTHPDILYGQNAEIVAENVRALQGTKLNYLGMLRTAYGVAKLDARWQSQP